MRRAAILLLATFMLLFVVACNNDPYVYKYDSTSYLGSWEINIAPIEGDVDGCIQLLQYEFKSDMTYGVVEYLYDAQTKIVQIVDGAEGTFEYDYDEDTRIGTLTLDGGPTQYYWTDGEGLSTLVLGRQYDYKRPKYIIRKAENQKDIVGIWESKNYDNDAWGISIDQIEFKSDGSFETYFVSGVVEPAVESETISWKYMDAEVEKTYSRTWSCKWEYGSEIIVSGPSSIGEDLHEKEYSITFYGYENYNDNGALSVADLLMNKDAYTIYQYGDKMLLDIAGTTYVKVSSRIDLSEKYKEIVLVWEEAVGGDLVYLRSDGTYATDFNNFLNYDRNNDTGFYTGSYSTAYNEVDTASVVAFEEARYKVENPGVEPVGGWDAWRTNEAALIEGLKANNYVKLFIGTISFTPDFGFAETFDMMLMIQTPKYGAEIPYGEPQPTYYLVIRNVDKEGNIVYYDYEDN